MWIKTQSSNTLIRAEILDLIRMDRGTDGYDITGQSFEPQALNIPLGTYKSKEIAEKALNEIIESMQTREEVVKVPIDWSVDRKEKWEVVVKWVTDNIEHFIGDGDFGVIERNDGVVCVKVSELNEVLRNAGLNIRHAISEFADRATPLSSMTRDAFFPAVISTVPLSSVPVRTYLTVPDFPVASRDMYPPALLLMVMPSVIVVTAFASMDA